MAAAAGLADVRCDSKPEAIESMNECNDPLYAKVRQALPAGTRLSDYVTSLTIKASKSTAGATPRHRGLRSEAGKPGNDDVSAGLDVDTTELVAIGASVAAHCQPCLAYHVTKARELGVADDLIREAIAVGHMVEKGAMSAMREFANSAAATLTQQTSACCAGAPSKDGKTCCG